MCGGICRDMSITFASSKCLFMEGWLVMLSVFYGGWADTHGYWMHTRFMMIDEAIRLSWGHIWNGHIGQHDRQFV